MPALSTLPTIEIDGAPLADGVASSLQEMVVDDHLHLPDTFELRFFDAGRTALADSRARVGSTVRISAGGLDEPTPQLLLAGEVTAIEAEYDENGGTLVLRGYDLSHRLTRGRRTRTWQNAKYSDVAREVATGAGLRAGTIDDSTAVLDYVSQANQSDWEFLWELARGIDYEVAVADGQLDFRKSRDASGAPSGGDYDSANPLQLVLGGRLIRFRPRVSGSGQVTGVEVRGWSMKDKDKIAASADAGTSSVRSLPDDPGSLAGRFGNATFVSVDAGPADQPAADRLAARIKEQIGSTFAEATGTARGDPRLKAGSAISVSTVGEAFEGSYTLTHTRHVFDLLNGYQTHLEVSGRQERSLLGLAATSGGGGAGGGNRMLGVAVALVDDLDDPLALGRVRLRLPWLGDDYVSDWARVATLGGGASRGAAWLPETDDEVLVAFEQGDIRRPYVLGGLWNGKDAAPTYQTDQGKQKTRSLVSRKGHSLVMRDGDDSATVELTSSDGKLAVVLDETSGEIKITADQTAKVTITAGGDLTISSQGRLKLEGQLGAELTSPAQVKVKGQLLQLNPPS